MRNLQIWGFYIPFSSRFLYPIRWSVKPVYPKKNENLRWAKSLEIYNNQIWIYHNFMEEKKIHKNLISKCYLQNIIYSNDRFYLWNANTLLLVKKIQRIVSLEPAYMSRCKFLVVYGKISTSWKNWECRGVVYSY